MSTYGDAIAADRRICILRMLEQLASYSANESVVQIVLEQFGYSESRDAVRTDLGWLQEQGVITVEVVAGRIWVAKLTDRGCDVAKGRVSVPGINRPSPDNAPTTRS